MYTDAVSLDWLKVSGTPREIGFALGRKGRHVVHERLVLSAIWQEITGPKHRMVCDRLFNNTQSAFPAVLEEIKGLASGLELPLEQVFAWNCRGDLLACVPDGCTTVQLPGARLTIAHNEDGLPMFERHCFIAEISPCGQPGFWSFCYPGSICGHTFALNEYNLAMTANNLRLNNVTAQFPRMVLGRAILSSQSIEDAISLISHRCESGGFHYTFAQSGQPAITSLEFGGGHAIRTDIRRPSIHANHALYGTSEFADQTITDSSRDRQSRGDTMLLGGEQKPMTILRDRRGPQLPIWRREPDDPDEENTIASVEFVVDKGSVNWTIYSGASHSPAYEKSNANN